MIILHAGTYECRIFLWGEVPATSVVVLPKQYRQKPKVSRWPYDAGINGLLAALKEVESVLTVVDKKNTEDVIARLPTLKGSPVASSPLIAEPPKSDAKPTLAPWLVTALTLSPAQVVDFLCACMGQHTIAPGVIVGSDIAFWATALRFAGALVARQQLLPGMTQENNSYYARWEPVFAGSDADRLSTLAKAMPPVCRALAEPNSSSPESPTISLLSEFISMIVDHLVRSSALLSLTQPTLERKKKKKLAFHSVHDQWLHALRSPDGVMVGDTTELAQLSEQIHEWQRPIALSTATPFRLCFRLEEPETDGDNEKVTKPRRSSRDAWQVRYLLQATDDPSLLIPASETWKAKGPKASILRRDGFNSREYVLSSLGEASRICPHIESSLKTSAPHGYALNASGALEFLSEKASVLEQIGFGVLLPAWWTRKGTKLRLAAQAQVKSSSMQAKGVLTLNSIIEFDWQIALGDQTLSFEELQALAKLKQSLVQVRGQWVQVSAEEIQAALDFWKQKGNDRATVREIVQMALGTERTTGPLAFGGVTATGWIADFLAQLDGRAAFQELVTPERFQGTLRPYQIRGYSWLAFLRRWGLGACLADDMGLGKTAETLALIQRDWESNEKRPVLVICPTSVVGNWQKEAARFTPDLPVMVHHGITRTKGSNFREHAEKQALIISSYALLFRDLDVLKEVPWAGVILDEAQNIKNPETKQAKAARTLKADYRLALTGTPVENHIGDLWSIMEFLNPGFLGERSAFKRTFFVPIQADRDPEALTRLKRLTGPFILRRLKTDKTIIADLPEKMEMKTFCTLTKEQASLYAAVVKDAEEVLESVDEEGIQRKGIVLATLSKLKQVCNHPAHFLGDNSPISGRSGKLSRLTEMLEEVLEIGDRALIFSQFAEMGKILQRHLQTTFGREALFLHGAVPKKQRDRMVERFQSDSEGPPIFILSLKAGGTGLNLTRATHVFHFDRWWNPAVENQATDRAFRIGQTKNVQVHKFLCMGTLEEKIDALIERKQELAAGVVGTGEGWLTELSTAELKELFALRREAIEE
ncbi:DEAD/DEAH box helicase [Candidatus Acetothermia bacterium]|nr:DEAD/DEAH box helicase [Candidatus Acetothermia bacterium]